MKKKETKEKKNLKQIKEKMNSQVPDEIKLIFGKFYVFSLIYVLFFGIAFPFYVMEHISLVSRIMQIVLLSLFYIYIVIDVKKKRKTFMSTIYIVLIVLVALSISFSIVKMFV